VIVGLTRRQQTAESPKVDLHLVIGCQDDLGTIRLDETIAKGRTEG
jgi:hypothetical protein